MAVTIPLDEWSEFLERTIDVYAIAEVADAVGLDGAQDVKNETVSILVDVSAAVGLDPTETGFGAAVGAVANWLSRGASALIANSGRVSALVGTVALSGAAYLWIAEHYNVRVAQVESQARVWAQYLETPEGKAAAAKAVESGALGNLGDSGGGVPWGLLIAGGLALGGLYLWSNRGRR